MEKEYYLGLDMGTSSIGWAVTDKHYNLLRVKGKDLWGVRLFSEANTAADRRVFRTSRRRRQREKARIGYLKEFFADEINKIDPGFYQRLEDSKYFSEDKSINQPYTIFAGNDYTDVDYYKQYPTIFHLRKELIENKEEHDIRLVFLAILNMFKHRGHFLNANLDGDELEDIQDIYSHLQCGMLQYSDFELPSAQFAHDMKEIIPSKKYNNSEKVEKMLECLGINKNSNKCLTEIFKLICGLKAKLSVIFTNEEYDEEGKKYAITFRDGNFDEKVLYVEELLSDEAFDLFMLMKQIYDWGILANIMKGSRTPHSYLSSARVESYEKHKYDLNILKKLYKEYAPEQYSDMFRVMADNNYSAYVGSVNSRDGKDRRGAKISVTDFYAKVKKQVSLMPDCKEKEYVLTEVEKESFLPKQLTSANGVIPNQVHKAELKKILNNAETYLTFLNKKDETGYTISQKIVMLFEFQIPYYIGPLISGNGTGWVVRKEMGKVFPWNIEQKVDMKESAERFIERMVRRCTYLIGENVLPKNSLLYEKFMVLNELNNLKINGEAITVGMKQEMYNSLFKKGKKVTVKHVENFLKKSGYVDNDSIVELSGVDGGFANTLSNYAKFTAIFEVDVLSYEQERMAENIIFWSTIYGDSKKFLKEKIKESYGNVLSDTQMKRIMGFKFKDWGRLSKSVLQLEGADVHTGEIDTIISRMWNQNYNFMELLSKDFTYINEINEQSSNIDKSLVEVEYEDLSELYISAPVKRMVWQTILILKELYKVLGKEPKKIFVEMARDKESAKERTISRKKKFTDLYKNCKEDGINWSKEIADTEEGKFKSKKLFLYYAQKGRCMYTGEKIELNDLFNDNLYDIDHIYPRHFVKDDSINNNLVLVKKEKNAHKSDNYPIESDIRNARRLWWKSLCEGGFITEEKYKRLVRNVEFTDDERAAFISRQIVETRQGTKVIANLFEKTFNNSEVIYVKAGNVSDFRKKFDLLKCREVNDYHHANDAYLNIVVGNVYNVKFTQDPINFIKDYRKDASKNKYHMYKLFDYTVQRNGEIAWDTTNDKSIRVVKTVMRKNTPLITRMNYEEHGGLADQTIYPAKDADKVNGEGYIPIKSTDKILENTCRYGGFKKYKGAYFFLVEHTQKKKRVRTLEAMPLYMKNKLKSEDKLEQYCKDVLKYEEPVIRLNKIKMYSLIKVNGFYLYLTGRSGAQLVVSNAVELVLDYHQVTYIKRIYGLYNEKGIGANWKECEITQERNIKLYDALLDKHCNTIYQKRPNSISDRLVQGRKQFLDLDVAKQVYILLQIIQLSQLSNMGADLIEIGGVKSTGVMTLNKKISDKDEFKLINQSITGLYENEMDLLTV